LCQKYCIVPIVEPEILWDGKHSIEQASQTAKTVLSCLFYHLNLNDVYIPGILVKPAFVTPGKDSNYRFDILNIATITFNCLIGTIPVAVPGIVFLSGGHDPENATLMLDAMNKERGMKTWKITFSYGRALSSPVMKVWGGIDKNFNAAQQAFKKKT